MRQRLLNETEEDCHDRKNARWEWRRKDHSLIHGDDFTREIQVPPAVLETFDTKSA